MMTQTEMVAIIWLLSSILATIATAEKAKLYGGISESARYRNGPVLNVLYLVHYILAIYFAYLLWDTGLWWLPELLRFIVIGPIIRSIYDI